MAYSLRLTTDGQASASSQRGTSWSADFAFNDNYADDWKSSTANKVNCWLQYYMRRPFAVTRYVITGGLGGEAPKAWAFEGYDVATAAWVTLDTQTGQVFDAVTKETRTYDIINSTKYIVYRLFITEQNGGTYTAIYELQMYGVDEPISETSGVILQTEIETTNPISSLSGLCIQVEYDTGDPIAQVGCVCLQVEVIEDLPPTPIIDPVVEETVYPELILPNFKPVELMNTSESGIADGMRELNRQLDWTFKSLTKAIIERKRLKNSD
jgi:hypothetical protein